MQELAAAKFCAAAAAAAAAAAGPPRLLGLLEQLAAARRSDEALDCGDARRGPKMLPHRELAAQRLLPPVWRLVRETQQEVGVVWKYPYYAFRHKRRIASGTPKCVCPK